MTRRGVTQAAGCHPATLSKRFQTWSLGRPLCILNTYHSLYARLCARPQDTSMIMGPTVQREVMVSHTPALDCWISRTFCSILDTTSQVTDRSTPSGKEGEDQEQTGLYWRLVHTLYRSHTVSDRSQEDFSLIE